MAAFKVILSEGLPGLVKITRNMTFKYYPDFIPIFALTDPIFAVLSVVWSGML